MFKSKKFIFIFCGIALLVFIACLPSLVEHSYDYTDDGKFIVEHQESIKETIIEMLDPEKKHIQSVTLLPGTAQGEYDNGGSISGNYHIYFSAYVNDNREQSLKGELSFPDAEIPPFTFIHPNPYEDADQDMTSWYADFEVSENSFWDWKREEEVAEYAWKNFADSLSDLGKSLVKQVQTERAALLFDQWLQEHQENFKSAIQTELYRADPELEQSLGKIQSIRLSKRQDYFPYSTKELRFDVTFEKYPEEAATIEAEFYSQDGRSIFKDSSVPAVISFYNGRFAIKSEADSKLSSIFSKSRLGNSIGEISYELPEDYKERILIP
ncbi:hypothetical protein DHL47_09070 [Streptococcus panodentis]|uniref:Uncharacterized protein n=1 Tax=Streptococcus panodentis TaxID=1581472 RepID=A0ABS5AY03_9STRE|nr:hypothetical protein [Streptococcus panodentis]